MDAIGIILVAVICLSIFGTFFNSILSRRSEGIFRRIYQARMNIHMGLMFLAIGSLQFMLPSESGLRLFFICLILAIGLINLYYGVKHHRYYRRSLALHREIKDPSAHEGL